MGRRNRSVWMVRGRAIRCFVRRVARVALMATMALTGVAMHRAWADTLEQALALAYQNNPQINAQRAATRATDEGVGAALGGYRPQVAGTVQIGGQFLDNLSRASAGPAVRSIGSTAIASYGLTVKQTLFNGFQT